MKLSSYDDINQLLNQLSSGLYDILAENLIGVYLTGSLTYGDFNRESSDIDFLVVTKLKIPSDVLIRIQQLHEQIYQNFPIWKKRLEGSYITESMLHSVDPPKESRPYINAGKMWQFVYGNEWVINKYALFTCGKVIFGPELHEIVEPVGIEQVREASKRDFQQDWLPKIQDPAAFKDPYYDSSHLQAYAVLTLCRMLFRQFHDEVCSKKVAAAWVKKSYPEWKDLVEKAEKWHHGLLFNEKEKIKKFIVFVSVKLK